MAVELEFDRRLLEVEVAGGSEGSLEGAQGWSWFARGSLEVAGGWLHFGWKLRGGQGS